jgi:hypothetical protein
MSSKLVWLHVAFFCATGLAKLLHVGPDVALFESRNASAMLPLFGVMQLMVALLLAFKATQALGVLTASAYLGGIAVSDVFFGQALSAAAACALLVLLWAVRFQSKERFL